MQKRLLGAAVAAAFASAISAQSPCFDPSLGTNLGLFDDDTSPPLALGFPFTFGGVTYTDVQVCSNGYIWLGTNPQSGGDFTPTAAELLADQPRLCPFWCDMDPSASNSGQVYFDASTPGVARITWAGVFAFGTTSPNFLQVTLDASNSVTVMYGANTQIGGNNTGSLIGASPGNGAVANPVSLATRPLLSSSDTWHETLAIGPGTAMPYSGIKMLWIPTVPGHVVTDVTCTPNSLPGPSSFDLVGQGCPARSGQSMYETFDSFVGNPPDLSGLDLTFLPSGPTDYLVLPGISPTWFGGFANNLNMTDDVSVGITLPFAFPHGGGTVTQIYVSSNGFLTLGPTDPGSLCCFGDAFTMLQGPPMISGFWADLYPPGAPGGGGVFADLDTATGDYVVTWSQVPEFFSGPLESFQIALSPSGTFTIRWQSVADTGHTWLAGYSTANGTADPGETDLSAVTAGVVSSTFSAPLEIDAGNGSAPSIGTTFQIDANNIQSLPNGVFSILLISSEIPGGIPLDGLGLTACTAYVALPELLSFFNLTLGNPTTSFSIPIPLDNAFVGVSLMSQAISDDLGANAFGYRVSNGLRWNIGL